MHLSRVIETLSSDQHPRWLEPLSYLLLAVGAVSGALVHSGHVIGDGVDLYGTFWFFWWIGDCIANFRDPSFTDLMFHPLGKDIFAHTGNNFVDAVIAQPFRWVFGFPRYQPWFVLFLLVGNALCFVPLARSVFQSRAAVWSATCLWMLNPFVLFELMCGRLTQALLWFMPLAIWQFREIGRSHESRWSWGWWQPMILAGLFTGLQGWTYWFGGYFLALGLGVLATAELVELARDRRWDWWLLGRWAIAGVACAAVVAPGAWAMATAQAASSVPGVGGEVGSIFEPPQALANNVSASLHGYVLQETKGQPMLGYWVWGGGFLACILWGRGQRRWLTLSVVALFFAVGSVFPRAVYDEWFAALAPWTLAEHWAPTLGVAPHQVPAEGIVMPHYMAAYAYVPFFDRLWFPYRLVVVVFLGLAICIGGLVDRMTLRRPSAAWGLGLALVIGTCLEQSRNLAYPLVHRDMTPPTVYEWIGEQGGGLVELPMGIGRVSIAWQAVHEQPTFGGMAENASLFWPQGYKERIRKNRFVRDLRNVTRKPAEFECCDLANQVAGIESLRSEGFRWVVLDRHLVDADLHRYAYGRDASEEQVMSAPFDAQDRLIAALGEPVAVEGPLVVWDLDMSAKAPEDLIPTAENLSTRTWPMDDVPAYEAHLRSLGRIE
jgi:hypothetical protein